MAVTLVFHGGLFSALPCSGPPRRIDVHIRLTTRVEVARKKTRLTELEALFAAAARVDFHSEGGLLMPLPLRSVSDVLPIDYQGFRKTVSFDGGAVEGKGRSIDDKKVATLLAMKKRGRFSEMRRAFETLTGISDPHHEDAEVRPLVQNFFASLTREDVRRWLPGYTVRVELSGERARATVNGRAHDAHVLKNGTRVEFFVDPGSTVPHFPSNDPHVLEHPPMS